MRTIRMDQRYQRRRRFPSHAVSDGPTFFTSSAHRRALEYKCNAGGARGNHIGPQEFPPRPSRTLLTPLPFPLKRPAEEMQKFRAKALASTWEYAISDIRYSRSLEERFVHA